MAVASGKIAEPITKVMQETGLRQEELLDESLQRQEELLSEIRRTLKENRSKRGFGFWSKDE
jgi:large-conductance mechanosensitive channel